MNIDQAKQEVKNAVRIYLEKDETGRYEIPIERQRPILLMGPPGIGKTAVMEQIAHELGIGLVSYTITHHTRQSAIGLPTISEKEYGGQKYSVTEYTMSEIIGAVYEQIEKSGIKEGILFLDEINCVSETLAPTMLQFLQYKTFGSHRLPEGYIIVTAGNPPQYNKSVRDFDIVTLDRVRQINITEDFDSWKEYAYKAGVHGAIMAYLEIKKDNFYRVKTESTGRSFVTARGWEDLSRAIKVSEKLGITVDENLTAQYLQAKDISEDFAAYYDLYRKYNELYKIPDILEGRYPEDISTIRSGSFDEKLSIIGLLTDALMNEFRDYERQQAVQGLLFETIKKLAERAKKDPTAEISAAMEARAMEDQIRDKLEAGLMSREQEKFSRLAAAALITADSEMEPAAKKDGTETVNALKSWFMERENKRSEAGAETGRHLSNALEFLEKTYGDPQSLSGSQEMVIFLTELSSAYHSLKFVRETGNETYYKYNKLLLLGDRRQELKEEVLKALSF
ncbi:MAG: AAA family ATPase [Butyrivibrio sp.]|nr:AAA family ATPase [Butyrivibrio sp.]